MRNRDFLLACQREHEECILNPQETLIAFKRELIILPSLHPDRSKNNRDLIV